MINKRKGFKFIHQFDKSEPVVSMIEFKGVIYVATSLHIYTLKDDKLTPIEFGVIPQSENTYASLNLDNIGEMKQLDTGETHG